MIDFADIELKEYGEYMDFIFNKIIDENKEKFNKVVKKENIELGHIHKYEGSGFDNKERWLFYYEIKNRKSGKVDHPLMYIEPIKCSNQIGFNEWLRLKKVNERDQKLRQLGL